MLRIITLLAFALLLIAATGCDSGEGGNNPQTQGTLTASVSGSSFDAALVTASRDGGVLSVAGVTNIDGSSGSNQRQIVIAVPNASVGSHSPSMSTPGFTLTYIQGSAANLETYVATGLSGSGTVNITEFTATGAKGTFTFTAYRDGNPNSGSQVEVTNGAFDVTF